MKERLARELVPVAAAVSAAFALEAGVFALAFAPAPPGYLAVCLALALGLALATGAVLAVLPFGAGLALAAWAASAPLLGLGGDLLARLVLGSGMALVTALFARARGVRERAVARGLVVGAALYVALVPWTDFARSRDVLAADGWRELSQLAIFAALLVAAAAWARLGLARRGLPSELWGVAAVSVALLAHAWASGGSDLPAEPAPGAARAGDEAPPSVLVLVLDTVRADHLSVYGYERDTSPELAAFARESRRVAVYPLAFSTATWTIPAHASLFTGRLPSEHGANRSAGGPDHSFAIRFDEHAEAPTLAEAFRRRGYRTRAVLANASLTRLRGVERGFDAVERPRFPRPLRFAGAGLRDRLARWIDTGPLPPYPDASRMNRAVLRAFEDCGADPCFVVANYMDAHAPCDAPAPHGGLYTGRDHSRAPVSVSGVETAELRRLAAARYDEEIHWLDSQLGLLLAELRSRGVLDRSWLVITSDHGESFGEHGALVHGSAVYNPQVRIPLLIQPPLGEGLPPAAGAVGLLDVHATLRAVAGAAPSGGGRDLRVPGAGTAPIEFFGTTHADERARGPLVAQPARAVVSEGSKLIEHAGRRELYRVDVDPAEERDLAGREPSLVESLARALPPLTPAAEAARAEGAELDADEEQLLRELGYVE